MKRYEIQQGYIVLSQAKLDGLSAEEKHKVISVARGLKAQATDFEEFIKDTHERVQDKAETNQIIEAEANKEVEIVTERLGDVFEKLLAHNSWNVAQVILLEDLLK